MLLALLPEYGLARVDGLTPAVTSADPPGPAHNGEQLRPDGGMPTDHTSTADLDHDDVRVTTQSSNASAHAPRRGYLALASELDPPHTRSITDAIAWPKPMHIVATP